MPKKKSTWIKMIWSNVWTGLVATVVSGAIIYAGKDILQKTIEKSVEKNLKIILERQHDEPQWDALKTLECRMKTLEKYLTSGLFGRLRSIPDPKEIHYTLKEKNDFKAQYQRPYTQNK